MTVLKINKNWYILFYLKVKTYLFLFTFQRKPLHGERRAVLATAK